MKTSFHCNVLKFHNDDIELNKNKKLDYSKPKNDNEYQCMMKKLEPK